MLSTTTHKAMAGMEHVKMHRRVQLLVLQHMFFVALTDLCYLGRRGSMPIDLALPIYLGMHMANAFAGKSGYPGKPKQFTAHPFMAGYDECI